MFRRVGKKILSGFMAIIMVASVASCSVDKGAMDLVELYANALVTRDAVTLISYSVPGSDTTGYDICCAGIYKDIAVDEVLRRTTVKVRGGSSRAKEKDINGSVTCVFHMPDYKSVLSSSPESVEQFVSMLDAAPETEVEVNIGVVFQNGRWYVSNPKEISDAIYAPLYDDTYGFVMKFEDEVLGVEWVGSDNGDYVDASNMTAVFSMSEEFVSTGVFGDLHFSLLRGEDVVACRGDVTMGDDNTLICSAEITESDLGDYEVFPQDDYTIVIDDGVENLFMAETSQTLTDAYFPDNSIYTLNYWLNEDVYGGYYNVDSFATVLALDPLYLNCGKEYDLTYSAWGPGGMLEDGLVPEYDGNNAILEYDSDVQLPTGSYSIVAFNNGTQIMSATIDIIDNLDPSNYTELDVVSPSDAQAPEGQTPYKILVYSNGRSNIDLLNNYTDVAFDYVTPSLNLYEHDLDMVLASGENAPDIFFCDSSYVSKYANSELTIPVNDIGISYSELRYMYPYTFTMPTDQDNVIKGVTWQITPGGVFYNRSVAQNYLGLSEPQYVQSFFATWDDVLNTARTLDEASGGTVKLVAGLSELESAYINGRTDPWIVDGDITLPDNMYDYLGFMNALKTEELTFGAGRWGSEWTSHISDGKVLSYWGSLWLGEYFLSNSYGTKFGLVDGPTDYFEGGNWIFVSSYCDMGVSAAEIIRDLTMKQSTLLDMVDNGTLVNNTIIMNACASDPQYAEDWLDGQNPYSIFASKALAMTGEGMGAYDNEINAEFLSVVDDYLTGIGIVRTEELASERFLENIREAGIV